MDLVELDGVGVTFKTVEALRGLERCFLFLNYSMGLNTKGAGRGELAVK